MPITYWIAKLIADIKSTSLPEWFGVGFGVAEVLLAKANNMLLYPAGIISVVITSYIFYTSGLYAESLLNAYYLVMSIYGWALWLRSGGQPPLPVSSANRRDWIVISAIVVIGFVVLAFVLRRWTDSSVPLWDAWVSATAWAGMWLLAHRKVENWLLLNLSNAFAIPLLLYKGLPLYALLTVILFVVAVQGYFSWKKILRSSPVGAR